jgi:hypothetical protein
LIWGKKFFFGAAARVARFFLVQNVKKYTQRPQSIPNSRKIDQICQHLPLRDPPNFPQIVIFGSKICHLATLAAAE